MKLRVVILYMTSRSCGHYPGKKQSLEGKVYKFERDLIVLFLVNCLIN